MAVYGESSWYGTADGEKTERDCPTGKPPGTQGKVRPKGDPPFAARDVWQRERIVARCRGQGYVRSRTALDGARPSRRGSAETAIRRDTRDGESRTCHLRRHCGPYRDGLETPSPKSVIAKEIRFHSPHKSPPSLSQVNVRGNWLQRSCRRSSTAARSP